MRWPLTLAALVLASACGNHAAERRASDDGEMSVRTAPAAPLDMGQGDNTGSALAPATTSDPPTVQPDQTGPTDEPVTMTP